jgi:hypothetical protein
MSMSGESGRDAHRIGIEFVSERSMYAWRMAARRVSHWFKLTLWGRNSGGKRRRIGEMSMRRVSGGDAVGRRPKFSLARSSGDFYFSLGSSGNRKFWRVGFP